ncbi:DUF2493 domain-containing protein [Priestia megaterium]
MTYYKIESDAEEVWLKWKEVEKYNQPFSRNVRSIVQNEYLLPHEQLLEWMEQTKEGYKQLKETCSEKVLSEFRKVISETHKYILSKKVETEEDTSSTLKIVVAGGREFNDYTLLKKSLLYLFEEREPSQIEIVSGGARGADSLGEKFAKEFGCKLTVMPAEWDLYGKSAGYRRNADMAKYSDVCICFWDKVSKGTKHMIDLANREGLELKVVNY